MPDKETSDFIPTFRRLGRGEESDQPPVEQPPAPPPNPPSSPRPAVPEPPKIEAPPVERTASSESDMVATQPDVLQQEIARRTAQGWMLVSRGAGEAQMRKPKRFSFLWFLAWTIPSFGTLFWVYLVWHWSKSDQLVYIHVVNGRVVITGRRGFFALLFMPATAYWRWAGKRHTTPTKLLAYGAPAAAAIMLIVIISAVSAANGGRRSSNPGLAAQTVGPTEDAGSQGAQVAQPTPAPKATSVPHSAAGAPGAIAEADHVRVTLNQVADPWISDNQFIQPDAGKRFVAFDVTIENTAGSGTHYANEFNFKLTDAQSFAYQVSFFGPDPSLHATELGSHQRTRGWVAFEVNEGNGLGQLTYDPNMFTNTDVDFHFQ